MTYHAHVPRGPLAEFVDRLWLCEDHRPAHARERVVPSGAMQIVVNLRSGPLRTAVDLEGDRVEEHGDVVVAGVYTRPFVIDTAQQDALAGVFFKPGGAWPFLSPSPAARAASRVRSTPAELCNRHVPLDALWGTDAHELRERLLQARTPQARFAVLEDVLLARVARAPAAHSAARFAVQRFSREPSARVADVCAETGLSHRHFVSVFRREVGLAPKVFARIRRFRAVLDGVESGRRVDWAGVALSCGFADQAHFVHEFREFSGMTPTRFAAVPGRHGSHVPLPDR